MTLRLIRLTCFLPAGKYLEGSKQDLAASSSLLEWLENFRLLNTQKNLLKLIEDQFKISIKSTGYRRHPNQA
jgi:hypothetical protein